MFRVVDLPGRVPGRLLLHSMPGRFDARLGRTDEGGGKRGLAGGVHGGNNAADRNAFLVRFASEYQGVTANLLYGGVEKRKQRKQVTNDSVIEKSRARMLEARAENSRKQQGSFAYHVIKRGNGQKPYFLCSVHRRKACVIENDLTPNLGAPELPMETGSAHGL